jgi:hypothetical protein
LDHEVASAPECQPSEDSKWTWKLSDLRTNQSWFKERKADIWKATSKDMPRKQYVRRQSMQILRRYGKTLMGKETMVNLLWWEWPEIFREQIRTGSLMNFIQTPPDDQPLTPNPEYTPEQLKVAVEFVTEIIASWVLEKVPLGSSLTANGPVVVLPKPGQPGQWRVISDMKSGGQNFYIANEPV